MSYLVTWGIEGEGTGHTSERLGGLDIHEAAELARSNGGVIFDTSTGQQLGPSDIQELLHPFHKLAEEIVGTIMLVTHPEELGGEVLPEFPVRLAIDAVEKCLEGSGLS